MKTSKLFRAFVIIIIIVLGWVIYSVATDDSIEVHQHHFGYPF
ncbi:hypothetical protein SAMN06265348_101123 [Pedobacter westerhofensis]|uniref:Uncharacterized protein n=1 Tax=Pedobacter westerhofensis TaxID=425512 RepID=A0A521AF63_9SPHI|nr:hypothetical protein SAMN06265348_101123 [Pedobacter westerhofensis]